MTFDLRRSHWTLVNFQSAASQVVDASPRDTGDGFAFEVEDDILLALEPVMSLNLPQLDSVLQTTDFDWKVNGGTMFADAPRLTVRQRLKGGIPGTASYDGAMSSFSDANPWWVVSANIKGDASGHPVLSPYFLHSRMKGGFDGWNQFRMFAETFSGLQRWGLQYLDVNDKWSILFDHVDDWSTVQGTVFDPGSWQIALDFPNPVVPTWFHRINAVVIDSAAAPVTFPLATTVFKEKFEDTTWRERMSEFAETSAADTNMPLSIVADANPDADGGDVNCLQVDSTNSGETRVLQHPVAWGTDRRTRFWQKRTQVGNLQNIFATLYGKWTSGFAPRNLFLATQSGAPVAASPISWILGEDVGSGLNILASGNTSFNEANQWVGWRILVEDLTAPDIRITIEVNDAGGGWVNLVAPITRSQALLHGVRAMTALELSSGLAGSSDRFDDFITEKF